MFNYVEKCTILLLVSALFSNVASAIEIQNLSVAVDVAGKQRMFTQRMLKDYAMIGLKNSFGSPKKDLGKIIKTFEDHLNSLMNFNTDQVTKTSLDKVKKLWVLIRSELRKTPNKAKAGEIQEALEALLKQSNEAVELFVKQIGKVSGETISISGRQRMLSQRMASLYMLKVWGVNDPKFKEKMNKSIELFENSLNRLMQSDMNTPEIVLLLQRVRESFMFFKIMNKSNNRFIPALIYQKSNMILRDMNKVTGLYVKQEKKEINN